MQHLTSYLQPLGALSLYLAIVTVYFADISIAQESSEKDEPKGSWYSYTPAPTVPADCLDGSYNTGICTTANNNERCSYDEGDCCECTCNDMTASGEGECAREFPSEECLDPDAPDAPCPTETPTTYPVTPIPSGTPVSTPTPRALQTEPPMPATAPSAPSPTRDIEVTPSPTSSSRVPPSTAPPPPGNNYDCPFPSGYGDGFCHVSNNNDSCDYDGGDCCECSCIVGEEFICGEASGYDCQDPSCLNDGKTGYFAGLLTSSLMVGRFMSAYLWGIFADRHGRLPVFYIGNLSAVLFSVGFGFSTTFWWAYTCRFLQGLLSGVQVVAYTMMFELCGKEHQIVGMGAATTVWSIGVVVGPGVAGMLAQPAIFYPGLFSASGLFGRYPYLLANLFLAGLALIALAMVCCFLPEINHAGTDNERRETLEESALQHTPVPLWVASPQLSWRSFGGIHGEKSVSSSSRARSPSRATEGDIAKPFTPENDHQPFWSHDAPRSTDWEDNGDSSQSLLAMPRVRRIFVAHLLYSFFHIGFDGVFPLWALSTLGSGGLDWTNQEIGQVLLTCGVVLPVFEIFAVPCITKPLGASSSFRVASAILALVYLVYPFLSRLHGTGGYLFSAVTALSFAAFSCSNAAFVGLCIAINNCTDESRRGEINGLTLTIGAIGIAVGTPVCSVVFAASISRDLPYPFNGHLVFILMAAGLGVVTVIGWNLIDDGRTGDPSSQGEGLRVDQDDCATFSGGSGNGSPTGQANENGTTNCTDS